MFGLLNVRKPSGCTSRDVVNRVQRLVRPTKVGHAGTLDPLATGVLILALGPATRLVPFLQQLRKSYSATFVLGVQSDTDDREGELSPYEAGARPELREIETAIPSFVGDIMQRPPDYSAVKVAGRRAYAAARRGEHVELSERPVTVYELHVTQYDYPQLCMDIQCGSGTYVRALGRDLAIALGTTAVMSELTRTAIGDFSIHEAIDIESLTADTVEQRMLNPLLAMREHPKFEVSEEQCRDIRNGRVLRVPDHGISRYAAAVNSAGEFVAVLRPQDAHHFWPDIVFPRRSI